LSVPLPVVESALLEAGHKTCGNEHRVHNGDELRQLDGDLSWLMRAEIDRDRLGAEAKMPRQQNMTAGREIPHREISLLIGHCNYVSYDKLYANAGVRRWVFDVW